MNCTLSRRFSLRSLHNAKAHFSRHQNKAATDDDDVATVSEGLDSGTNKRRKIDSTTVYSRESAIPMTRLSESIESGIRRLPPLHPSHRVND